MTTIKRDSMRDIYPELGKTPMNSISNNNFLVLETMTNIKNLVRRGDIRPAIDKIAEIEKKVEPNERERIMNVFTDSVLNLGINKSFF
jgi:hypothetical protein